jgi:hypothetical protein
MRDDDDALAGVDLAAWQPPPPPADLASAVVARLREPTPAAALDPHERTSRRPRWIGGIAVVAVAAAVAVAWFARSPSTGRGAQIATRAEHLALDGSVADLDAGTELRWERDRHRITAHHARGIVRWTVADDDTLVIEPGGATTATIEASGASLRVEVQMNLSDMRMLGASTATAAAISLVTVVVYTGHVKATSGGQTVTVAPGATIELQPPATPREVAAPRPEPIVAGASQADIQRLEAELRTANDKIAALTAERVPPIAVAAATLDALRLKGNRNILPDEATRLAIARAGVTRVAGLYKLCIDTSGAVASIKQVQSTKFAAYDRTIEQAILGWTYRPYLSDGKATPACSSVSFAYDAKPAPAVDHPPAATPDTPTPVPEGLCDTMDIDDLLIQAQNQYTAGFARVALATVTKALACKQDTRMYRLAAMCACAGHDAAVARRMYQKLPARFQAGIEQRCQSEGIDLRADH